MPPLLAACTRNPPRKLTIAVSTYTTCNIDGSPSFSWVWSRPRPGKGLVSAAAQRDNLQHPYTPWSAPHALAQSTCSFAFRSLHQHITITTTTSSLSGVRQITMRRRRGTAATAPTTVTATSAWPAPPTIPPAIGAKRKSNTSSTTSSTCTRPAHGRQLRPLGPRRGARVYASCSRDCPWTCCGPWSKADARAWSRTSWRAATYSSRETRPPLQPLLLTASRRGRCGCTPKASSRARITQLFAGFSRCSCSPPAHPSRQ